LLREADNVFAVVAVRRWRRLHLLSGACDLSIRRLGAVGHDPPRARGRNDSRRHAARRGGRGAVSPHRITDCDRGGHSWISGVWISGVWR
jgi:hypothetical protein